MLAKILFVLFAIMTFTPWVNAPLALVLGFGLTLVLGNPFEELSKIGSKNVLQWSIIGLGFGLQLESALEVSKAGFWLTISTIAIVFFLVYILNKFFKLPSGLSKLIASGTAICGGSAIAAVAPVIKAKSEEISMAIGTVFILNAIALFIFPVIGRMLDMTQFQFGLWSAIAIHDTSSVVGAAQAFGDEALELATTVKLSRALWIIPVSLAFSLTHGGKAKISIPYFIVGFILTMLIAYFFPAGKEVYSVIATIAKKLLVLALFLIGASMKLSDIKKSGTKAIGLGSIVWVLISIISLLIITKFY